MSTDVDILEYETERPRRRRRDPWRPAAIVAIVVAVVAATVATFVVLRRDDSAPSPAPSASPTASPTPTASPSPTATQSPPVVVPDEPIGAAWPLTTTREVATWRADPSAFPYLTTAVATAQAFATRYLGIPDASVRRTPSGAYEVTRPDPNGQPYVVTRAVVEAVDGRTPFVVRSASKSEEMVVAVPAAGATISSPLTARGTYTAVDPSIRVEVRESGGVTAEVLGFARATYSPQGWAATVTFAAPARRTGSVLVTNGSLTGEGIAAAWVVPVLLAPAPAYPSTFAGVESGRIALYRTSDGTRLRFLTAAAPGGGDSLPRLTADRTRVRFVRGTGTCSASLMEVRTDGTGLRTVIPSTPAGPVTGAVDTARGIAYATVDCATGVNRLMLRRAGGVDTTLLSAAYLQTLVAVSHDGRFVYALTSDTSGGRRSVTRVDVERRIATTRVPAPADCTLTALASGYLAGGTYGVVVGRVCGSGGTARGSVVVLDERLATQRQILWLDARVVTTLAVDASGRHLLMLRTGSDGVTEVQRWLTGRVVPVAHGPEVPVW